MGILFIYLFVNIWGRRVKKSQSIFLFYFIYLFIFTLQYYIGFAIHQHASAMGVHVFPILPPPTSLPSHPSGSSQCTSSERPVSCIKPGLAICFTYGNIHVSMPFSQITPSSPSPTESNRLFLGEGGGWGVPDEEHMCTHG